MLQVLLEFRMKWLSYSYSLDKAVICTLFIDKGSLSECINYSAITLLNLMNIIVPFEYVV